MNEKKKNIQSKKFWVREKKYFDRNKNKKKIDRHINKTNFFLEKIY